jgi:hypothetical protein
MGKGGIELGSRSCCYLLDVLSVGIHYGNLHVCEVNMSVNDRHDGKDYFLAVIRLPRHCPAFVGGRLISGEFACLQIIDLYLAAFIAGVMAKNVCCFLWF